MTKIKDNTMFQGYTQQTIDFLWGLRFNNERSWFLAHKEEFLEYVDGPTRALAAQLSEAMTEAYPKLGLECKVSRIYRDARRLHGRGPYKEHLWFSLRHPSERGCAAPCFFFELAPERYSYGMGCWDPTPLTMAKVRARIDRDPKPVEKLARQVIRRGEFVVEGELYKRPKGDPGPLLYPWYNQKKISFCRDENCEGIFFTPELAQRVLDGWKSLVPHYRWMREVASDPDPRD